jgi:hypothetical protein
LAFITVDQRAAELNVVCRCIHVEAVAANGERCRDLAALGALSRDAQRAVLFALDGLSVAELERLATADGKSLTVARDRWFSIIAHRDRRRPVV